MISPALVATRKRLKKYRILCSRKSRAHSFWLISFIDPEATFEPCGFDEDDHEIYEITTWQDISYALKETTLGYAQLARCEVCGSFFEAKSDETVCPDCLAASKISLKDIVRWIRRVLCKITTRLNGGVK